MKKLIKVGLIMALIVVFPLLTYFVIESSGATVETEHTKVVYNLPYPGILPDHPLYFIKIVRDRVNEFASRDPIKKAQIYLLYADKRAVMATALSKKGKNQQAISTFSKGEKYMAKIPQILIDAKTQGNSAPSGFIITLKLSNAKHKEMIQDLLKTMPQGMNDDLNEVLKINDQTRQALEQL